MDWHNLFALDENDERVNIEDTLTGHKYFCEACHFEMVAKKGPIRVHHFAHKPGSECVDSWIRHYDMSGWHLSWQKKFPDTNQEVVLKNNGETHRADVFINRTVIEFQHSPISAEHFRERNVFYRSLGFKIVWVFDAVDDYNDGKIRSEDSIYFNWSKPFKNFRDFQMEDDVSIYLQIKRNAIDDKLLQDYLRNAPHSSVFTESNDYISSHKDDVTQMIKIEKIIGEDISHFKTDGLFYYEGDFLSEYIQVSNTVRRRVFSDLFESIHYKYSRGHTNYFCGCPVSSSGFCASTNIDTPESKYNEIMPCSVCGHGNFHLCMCKKRLDDLGVPPNAIVTSVRKDELGKILQFHAIIKGVSTKFELPPFKVEKVFNSRGESLLILASKLRVEKAIFRNIKTGWMFKVSTNPQIQYEKYGKCYGRQSKDGRKWSDDSIEIFGCTKPEWVCEWHKTKEELSNIKNVEYKNVYEPPFENKLKEPEELNVCLKSEKQEEFPLFADENDITLKEKDSKRNDSSDKKYGEVDVAQKTPKDIVMEMFTNGEITVNDILELSKETELKLVDIAKTRIGGVMVVNTGDGRLFYFDRYWFGDYDGLIEFVSPAWIKRNPKMNVYVLQNENKSCWIGVSVGEFINKISSFTNRRK